MRRSVYYIELRSQSGKSHRIRTIKVEADDFIWGQYAVTFRRDNGEVRLDDVLTVNQDLVVSVSHNQRLRT